MKKHLWVFALFCLIIVILSVNAHATSVSFGDTKKQWTNSFGNHPDLDVWGTPDILGGTADIKSNGALNSLTINIKSITDYWYMLEPGSLFIDKQADGIWDYLVDTAADTTNGSDPAKNYNLFAISQPFDNAGTNSNYRFSYSLAGGTWRYGAPVSMIDASLTSDVGDVYFSGWPAAVAKNNLTSIMFSGFSLDIILGNNFTVAFAPTCANDVLIETLRNPVPEPATMLLVGSGLIGLAGLRKKFRKA